MTFYPLPFGHAEWRVDSRDPRLTRRPLPPLREGRRR